MQRKKKLLLVSVIVLFIYSILVCPLNAKTNVKLVSGAGNMEHFSTGLGIDFCSRHSISVLYGSNFFIQTQSFSSYLLQYEYVFKHLKKHPLDLSAGFSGGYTIYSNTYYKWELMEFIILSGISYAINERLKLKLSGGAAFSREISMKRINYGEIGWYKKLLPEFKLELNYVIF